MLIDSIAPMCLATNGDYADSVKGFGHIVRGIAGRGRTHTIPRNHGSRNGTASRRAGEELHHRPDVRGLGSRKVARDPVCRTLGMKVGLTLR